MSAFPAQSEDAETVSFHEKNLFSTFKCKKLILCITLKEKAGNVWSTNGVNEPCLVAVKMLRLQRKGRNSCYRVLK